MQPKLIEESVYEKVLEGVKVELTAAHVYQYLANWCDCYGYLGAKKWYNNQSNEEREHAQKVIEYLLDRNCEVPMPMLKPVSGEYKTIYDVLKETLKQEQIVEAYWKSVCVAVRGKDESTYELAQWYIHEQVGEIESVCNYITQYEMMCADGTMCGYANMEMDKILGS